MTIYIGSDHAGFKLKEEVKSVLTYLDIIFEDLTPEFQEGDDYPDAAVKVSKKVLENNSKGILICGSGAGITMAANKVPGIRAATAFTEKEAQLMTEHEDANILVLSGWFEDNTKVGSIIGAWLNSAFQGDRHQRRLDKIKEIENKYSKS